MAVPILRLNIDDNPRIIVKQDSIPVTITGYTQTIVQGSGATTVTESGVNPKIYTVYTPIGSAQWGSILGDVTTQTDLTDYVTQSISAATSGLTSSWNGLTGLPTDNSDLVTLLSGYTLTGDTHLIELELTGLTSSFNSHTGDTAIHFTKSSINLDDLGDVVITNVQDNDVLIYSLATNKWINSPILGDIDAALDEILS